MIGWLLTNLVLVGAVLIAIGTVAVVLAWRGRRIDDHPVCARCRFDLVGLDTRGTCPECGVSLAGRSALRVGNRKRSGAVVSISIGAMLLGIALGAVGLARTAPGLMSLKPVPLLVFEATNTTGASQQAAFDELELRKSLGKLSARQWAGVVNDMLRHAEADTSPPDELLSVYFVEACWRGWLTQADFERVVDEWYAIELEVAETIQIGGPITVKKNISSPRVENSAIPGQGVWHETISVGFEGSERRLASGSGGSLYSPSKGTSTYSPEWFWPQLDPKPGRTQLSVDIEITIGSYKAQRRRTVPTELVLAEVAAAARVVTSKDLDDRMREALELEGEMGETVGWGKDRIAIRAPMLQVEIGKPPVNALAHRAVLVWADLLIEVDEIVWGWDGADTDYTSTSWVTGADPSEIENVIARDDLPDLFLVPLADAPRLADQRLLGDEVWGGAAVFRSVPMLIQHNTYSIERMPYTQIAAEAPTPEELARIEAWLSTQSTPGAPDTSTDELGAGQP